MRPIVGRAERWTRTTGAELFKLTLYQLSYLGSCLSVGLSADAEAIKRTLRS